MQTLIGPVWLSFIPALIGLAFVVLILALKPNRYVKIGAYIVGAVSLFMSIGFVIDELEASKQLAAYDACKAKRQLGCDRYLGVRVILPEGLPAGGQVKNQ